LIRERQTFFTRFYSLGDDVYPKLTANTQDA
jgi:hypothetical protein